jgi:hypothetical protein
VIVRDDEIVRDERERYAKGSCVHQAWDHGKGSLSSLKHVFTNKRLLAGNVLTPQNSTEPPTMMHGTLTKRAH